MYTYVLCLYVHLPLHSVINMFTLKYYIWACYNHKYAIFILLIRKLEHNQIENLDPAHFRRLENVDTMYVHVCTPVCICKYKYASTYITMLHIRIIT